MSQRSPRPASTDHAADELAAPEPTTATPRRIGRGKGRSGLAQRIAAGSLAEAEARYVDCRDAWTAAMKAASSGRPADMASLAICQEEYEAAAAERDRWLSGARVAIPIQPEAERQSLDAVVDQTMAWREVQRAEKPRGLLRRLFGRRERD